jgi:tetratricopeptide (TPR) repeat protein
MSEEHPKYRPEIGNYVPNAQGSNIIDAQTVSGNTIIGTQINNSSSPLPPTKPPSNLPPSGTYFFVGREETLQQVHQQLQESNQRAICAVSGMGGIGKTELAVRYAIRYQDEYSGGLCWLQCRIGDLGTQITNYGRSLLGLTIPDGLELLQQVHYCWQHWRTEKVLMIFDDVTDYGAIASFLPPSNKVQFKVLMTSRIQPHPITGIRGIDLPVLDENSALKLLRSLVGDGEKPPEQNRIDREIHIAKGLCEWLGYLPLGLELVGGYLAQSEDMSLKELWEELNDERLEAEALQSIEGELKNPLGLVKAFLLSWESLGVEAKKLGCQLSLFASADILWEWVEKLFPQEQSKNVRKVRDKELLKFSLLQKTGDKKYKLHSLIRKFFITKQDEIENIDDCKRDICRVMVAIAKQIPSTITLEVIESTTSYIPHLREVGESLMGWVEDEVLTWPFVGLGRIYEGQSQFTEAEKWYKQSAKVTRVPFGDSRSELRLGERHPDVATSYNNLALLYSSMGRYKEAFPSGTRSASCAHYQQAINIAEETLGENHPNTVTITNNYLQMLRQAPTEEILKALPEEMHENYLKMRSHWEKDKPGIF